MAPRQPFHLSLPKRHPQIAATVAHVMDCYRVLSLNTGNLNGYFNRLYDVIHCNHIYPKDMWNFDEKGFLMGQGEKQNELVIARVHMKSPWRMQDGSWEWVTLIECVSAMGTQILAYYVHVGQAYYEGSHCGTIEPETGFYFTSNGWTNDHCSLNWLKNHFEQFCPCES